MAAFVVPKGEGGEVDVYASTQALTDTQRWVAQVTGVPRNRVVAHSKRLGGGFGGKSASLLPIESFVLTVLRLRQGDAYGHAVCRLCCRGEEAQATSEGHARP